jgi:hypothetical protein
MNGSSFIGMITIGRIMSRSSWSLMLTRQHARRQRSGVDERRKRGCHRQGGDHVIHSARIVIAVGFVGRAS